MNGYWLVTGLLVGTLNVMICYQFWWAVPMFAWLLILLVTRFKKRLCLTVLTIGSYGTFFGAHQVHLNQLGDRPIGDVKTTVMVHPDELHFTGTTITGFATLPNKERVRLTWFCKDKKPFRELQRRHDAVVISGSGQYEKIAPRRNAYTFDPVGYWRSRGIMHQLVLTQGEVKSAYVPTNAGEFVVLQIRTWHRLLVQWFERLPPGIRDYGETLFLGYTRRDFYDDNLGIQKMGLVHLFSISGFQVAGLYVIWRRIGRWLGITRERSLLIVQLLLLGLLLFAGGVQSLVRAVLLALTQAWRELGWLRLSAVDAWGIALLGGLLLEPGVLHNLGGQLFYLLTFGLLCLEGKPGWWQCVFLSLLILPLLLWHTYAWHPIGILANLIAMPLFTWLVIPVLTVGILAAWLNITALTNWCNAVVDGVRWTIAQTEGLPGELTFGQPPVLLCAIVLIGTLVWLAVRRWWILGILGTVYGIMLLLPNLLPGGFATFVDVGQGDANIIKQRANQVMMVDVGGKLQLPQPDWAAPRKTDFQAQQLAQYLKGNGITKIQQLVLTHKDVDHIGNLPHFLKLVRVETIYVPLGMQQSDAYKRLVAPYIGTTEVREVRAGMRLNEWTTVQHPFEAGTGENEDSVALLVNVGPKQLMMTGDLDQAGEERIIQNNQFRQVELLKLGHHGSKTSTAQSFVHALKPQIGIVSAGVNNRFGHPNKETLSTTKEAGMTVFNTAENGMLQYHWCGNRDWWQAEIK